MFLSDFIGKPLLASSTPRGTCLGVGISLKTFTAKYLLCSSQNRDEPDFCVNLSSTDKIGEAVYIPRLRPVFPKNYARILPNLPLFLESGEYLGKIFDLEIQKGIATRIITDTKRSFPTAAILACADAIILRKNLSFPIGQRVPAPVLSRFSDKTDALVTKPLLRNAITQKSLITLTLSLPPFCVQFLSNDT